MKIRLCTRLLLFLLLAGLIPVAVRAQEEVFQVVDQTDLPALLNKQLSDSCRMEFREQWSIDANRLSLSKQVEEYLVHCAGGSEDLPPPEAAIRLRDITYEFSFLDPHQADSHRLQAAIIALIDMRYPVNKIYNMPAQLLSIYFHEEWIFDPVSREIKKKVRGITPVIWQKRQTEEGEPVNDGDTGLPVYFKLKLNRINLRQP